MTDREPMPLPRLLDCRGIMDELGVKRSVPEAIMRRIPKVQIEGNRRVFCRRDDVLRLIDESTNDVSE